MSPMLTHALSTAVCNVLAMSGDRATSACMESEVEFDGVTVSSSIIYILTRKLRSRYGDAGQ